MDKEHVKITIKAETSSSIGDHFQDERIFEVDVPSRADVSTLFEEFTDTINGRKEWEQ